MFPNSALAPLRSHAVGSLACAGPGLRPGRSAGPKQLRRQWQLRIWDHRLAVYGRQLCDRPGSRRGLSGGGGLQLRPGARPGLPGSGHHAEIYDVDGVTRLAGTAFSTQIYAGSSPDALRPLGSGKYFNSGWGLGFFAGFWVNPARPTRVPLRHRAPSAAQSLVAAGGGDQPDRLGLLHRPAAAPRQHGPLPRAHSGLRWLETRVGATGRRGDRTTRPRDDGTTG